VRQCRLEFGRGEPDCQVSLETFIIFPVITDRAMAMFSLDLSWNYASESQAYDRVHRLGQEKDVFVKRLVVRNTIEERCVDPSPLS